MEFEDQSGQTQIAWKAAIERKKIYYARIYV